MGKKQGQAQRTKGNAQPSSSAKAAEMLQQSTLSSGYSFGSEIPPIGIGTLIEDSFDSSLDSEFRVALKKLYKKDTLTKSKALEELKNLIETKSTEDCLQILPYWSKSYTKLSLDNDRRIREQCQLNHERLCSRVTKNLAPYLKTIMPYWILAQSDSHAPTSRLAEQSFKNTFNEAKRPEVVFFARDEIINVLQDYLIVQTYKTLSDLKSVSEDEALQKFESVVCICLRGLDLFLRYYLVSLRNDSQKAAAGLSLEKLEQLIMDQKFWKYAKDNSLKIRAEFFQLLSSLIDLILLLNDLETLNELKQSLKQKIIPLVFYACDEDNNTCAFYIWQCIIKCSTHTTQIEATNFWSLLNVKKAFIPKLISLLRSHANQNANSQNADIIYTSLLPLISTLNQAFDDYKEKLTFYTDLFTKLSDALARETSIKSRVFSSNKNKIIEALFACSSFVLNDLVRQDADEVKQFLNSLISDHILALLDLYLLNKLTNEANEFEVQFVKFIRETLDDLESSDLKQHFWSRLNSTFLEKMKISDLLDADQLEEANTNLSLVKRFSSLFKTYWSQTSSSNQSFNLLNLIRILFAQYLTKFKSVLTSEEFTTTKNNHLDDLGYAYLSGINILCLSFRNDSFKSSLLHNFNDFNSLDLLIDHLVGLVKHRQNDLILFGLIDLYFILREEKEEETKLDSYLLESSTSKLTRLDNLFAYYFKSNNPIGDKFNLIGWFTKSSQFARVFTQDYLNSLDEKSRFDLTLEFISFLINNSNDSPQVNLFYDSIVRSIISLTGKYLENDDPRSRLNDLVSFSIRILFHSNHSLRDQNQLWTLLINSFKLKLQTHLVGLNDLIDKLSFKLFKQIYEKSVVNSNIFTQLDDYAQLIDFIISTIRDADLNEHFQNELILLDLINQFDKTLVEKENAIEQFYSEILFKLASLPNFTDLFHKLLFVNTHLNRDLLAKFYVDSDLNYLYSSYYSLILESSQDVLIETSVLKQVNYSLKILNVYFELKKQNSSRLISILMNEPRLANWWLYLVLSSILVTKLELTNMVKLDENYHLAVKLVDEIKREMSKLFYETNFLKLVLCSLDLPEFSARLAKTEAFSLELNNLSLFLFELVDQNAQNNSHADLTYSLNKFAYELSNQLVEQKQNEQLVRHYLYDLPFARYSIVQNLNEIKQNSANYSQLFEALIRSQVDKLNLDAPLEKFNFHMSLLVKYSNYYFYYLKKSNTSDQFLNEYLVQVLDILIKQKETQASYLIYYEFEKKNWNQFVHLDNLNQFLTLFFELKSDLNDKQWDFVLCYSAAISQYLDKNSARLAQLNSSNELELFSVHFFQFVSRLVRSIHENKNHPKLNEWNGFFSKEIFDSLLSLFVKLADFYSQQTAKFSKSPFLFNTSLKTCKLKLVKTLSSIVSQTPFERLMLNTLEPKFNVLDLSVDQTKTSIKLTDSLKTVFNHLVPHLKHEMKSFQLGAYKVLSKIMNNVCTYYVRPSDEDSDEQNRQLNIFESLPHVLKDLLFELNDLFSNLKTNIHFEENILVTKLEEDEQDARKLNDLCHDVNRKLMSYMLLNRLVLDMFTSENLEFKVKLVNDLREINFNDYLVHSLFRLMPKSASSKMFATQDLVDDLNSDESFSNESVQMFACQLYKHALKCVPAMIRDWYHIQTKRIADLVDKYTTKYVSPVLLEEDIVEINRSANLISEQVQPPPQDQSKKKYVFEDDEQSTIKIRGMLSTREIVSTYKMKELNMELIIQLPLNYPLGVVDVSSVRRLGVSENEWRNWLIQLTTYLTHQNGSIIQSLQIWKRNVDKKFSGVEECTICYNVIHGTNYQLPKKKCRTCKKLFHSICLYKWFESSSKSTCPLCRNLF